MIGQFSFSQNINNRSLNINDSDKLIRLPESFIIESEIDPDTYILGPSDKIGLSIMSNSHLTYILSVTPSGELWIPEIGIVEVSGLTIPEAEIKLQKYIQDEKYNTAEVLLILLNIRKFKVQINGAVVAPGFINVSAVDRLTDIIHRAGGLHKLADEEKIVIKRKNFNINCSLKSYQFNGDLANNPILKEGDVVNVPFLEPFSTQIERSTSHKKSLVLVTGFVMKPGGHQYLPGYTIQDYIALSGGITDLGSKKKVALYRNGEEIPIDLQLYPQPGDQIDIPANMKFRYLGNISILQTFTAVMSLYLTFVAATN
ncbi:MAG: SLBB domain-containing protein [Candidatus Marinimicrobia bacterium]|nr:SLBB domain-containing protein [Candidatus Neomarinimicrobiota bacterium]